MTSAYVRRCVSDVPDALRLLTGRRGLRLNVSRTGLSTFIAPSAGIELYVILRIAIIIIRTGRRRDRSRYQMDAAVVFVTD